MEFKRRQPVGGKDGAVPGQVLIVEDDEGLNTLLRKSLGRAGFLCKGALSGAQAMSITRETPGLALLVDQRLPDMDGTDLIRKLAEQGHQVPFVAMTGHGDEKLAVEMMKLGARDYLVKGTDLTDRLPMVFKRLFNELETEEKLARAEQKLKEDKALYKSLLETTRAIAYELDLASMDYTYISPQIYDITGYPVNVWRNFEFWADTLHPDDRDRCVAFCKDETREGRDHEFEYRMIKADGETLWLKDMVSLVKQEAGPVALRGFLIDITEQKTMESRLRQTHKMEAIGNLSGGIAHDFNNILFPIMGMSELLMEDAAPDSSEHHYASEIYKAATRGSGLVSQILAFSRRSEQKIIPMKIQPVLAEVLKLVRATIPANIDISSDIDRSCGPVTADPTQIHQVLMNLMTNAFHAVEKNGGSISVRLKAVEPESGDLADMALEPGGYAGIWVSDTGEGIPPGVLDKIFDPYFTTKKQGRGTGLGLAVVYGIVKKHNGEIKVDTKQGKGTEFTVCLPLAGNRAEAQPPGGAGDAPGGNESILLVDDDPPVLQLETQILARLGYRVQSCSDAQKALAMFESSPGNFDLVITDMTMPGITGDILAQKMLAAQPDLPIIICTGFSERMNDEKAAALGVKGLLMKPVGRFELAETVRKALEKPG